MLRILQGVSFLTVVFMLSGAVAGSASAHTGDLPMALPSASGIVFEDISEIFDHRGCTECHATDGESSFVWTSEPVVDYLTLMEWLDLNNPQQSELFRYAGPDEAAASLHPGGMVFETEEDEDYKAILEWIDMGVPFGVEVETPTPTATPTANATPTPTPPDLYFFGFDTPGDTEGWVAENVVDTPLVEDGMLQVRSLTSDPMLINEALFLSVGDVGGISVRFSVSEGRIAQLLLVVDDAELLGPLSESIPAENEFVEVVFPIPDDIASTRVITTVRFDPTTKAGVDVAVDSISFVPAPTPTPTPRLTRVNYVDDIARIYQSRSCYSCHNDPSNTYRLTGDPTGDYLATLEQISFDQPTDSSLFLTIGPNQSSPDAHPGGLVFETADVADYQIILNWIVAGASFDSGQQPTPTLTPTPEPTQAGEPERIFHNGFDAATIEENELVEVPGGFAGSPAGAVSFGVVPTENVFAGATDGLGMSLTVDPGEVALVYGTAIEADAPVLVSVAVRSTGPGVQIALAAMDASGDGTSGTQIANNSDLYSEEWQVLTMVHDAPTDSFYPILQAANLAGTEPVTVYFDNLEAYALTEDTRAPGALFGTSDTAP